jgi:2-keto-4-pentenoate hydratase/2-oxohepta-3-ene-1,7-dioic acid hydratase in catechol pathway
VAATILNQLTLAQIVTPGGVHLAAKLPGGLLDVTEAAARLAMPVPASMDELLAGGRGAEVEAVVKASAAATLRSEASVKFAPIVSRPEKILCIGLNYKSHVKEVGGRPLPEAPVVFGKYNNALAGHGSTLELPTQVAHQFDYEVELVVVVGRRADNISEARALDYVAGYATGNDFTARELQRGNGGQWLLGKSLNGSAPVGPYLVSADQVDPDHLPLECRVNGKTRQSSNTDQMIFPVRQLISFASRHMTLQPGDLIFTGTPEGVILGYPRDEQVWLKAGDEIACTVGTLGELRFTLA